MTNPGYLISRLRSVIQDEFAPSRETSLALTKLDEAEMWLQRATPTAGALERDGADS